MTLGDFIVTNDFVRVFLVETKTDSYKTGQWATFSASLRPYELYRRLVVALSDELNPEEIAQWPVMLKGDGAASHRQPRRPRRTGSDF